VCRKVLGLGVVGQAVADANRDLVEAREDVELRQGERRDAVDTHGEAQRHEIEPAAAAHTARHCPELAAELADALLRRALDLAGERALADARDVRLRDADDLVDPLGADAEAHRRTGCDGARRRDERVGAVVEVEQCPLRTLEENPPSFAKRSVDEQRRVGDVGSEPLRVRKRQRDDLLRLERIDAVDPF